MRKLIHRLRYGTFEEPAENVRFAETTFFWHIRRTPIYLFRLLLFLTILYGIPWLIMRAFDIPDTREESFLELYFLSLFVAVFVYVYRSSQKQVRKDRLIELVTKKDLSDLDKKEIVNTINELFR